jgi:ATP/maltotriose-dependent transcriptional regulator MalT
MLFKFFSSSGLYNLRDMTMSFLLHDQYDSAEQLEFPSFGAANKPGDGCSLEHLLLKKLEVPVTDASFPRPNLMKILRTSENGFSATLISGRSGTGKTSIAANYARKRSDAVWLALDPPDTDWELFARHLRYSISKKDLVSNEIFRDASKTRPSMEDISRFLALTFAQADQVPSLIVLDDVHHIFDAAWFSDFFSQLVMSIPQKSHLMLICRSKPPGPLWRMRSKQVLNVIDESVIAFTETEAIKLFAKHGLSRSRAIEVNRKYYGRVAKVIKTAENESSRQKR